MAVPAVKEFNRPILEILAKAAEGLSHKQIFGALIPRFSLTEVDLQERTPSGKLRAEHHLAWDLTNLRKAGLLRTPTRGQHQITDEGREFLATHNGVIEQSTLTRLAAERQQPEGGGGYCLNRAVPVVDVESEVTPDEQLETSIWQLQDKLTDDLVESIKEVSPYGFERLVVDLLVKMGYGKGEAVGRSGDGGIDGIINQDPLGLEKVYVQAKRWASQVGEPEIRNFSGSLDARGASKGVFITTSHFSASAQRTAETISAGNKFIRLIDGDELARLMIEHGVGVVTEFTYELKKLDENYFSEFADL